MSAEHATKLESDFDKFIAHEDTLDNMSKGKTKDGIKGDLVTVRTAMKAALGQLPDRAFASQADDADGNEVWSAGQVVTHCNGVMTSIAKRLENLQCLDAFQVADDFEQWTELRNLTRDEALQAVDALPIDQLFDSVPADADLEAYDESDFFGKMPGRAWLNFIALHEANHNGQLHELMEA